MQSKAVKSVAIGSKPEVDKSLKGKGKIQKKKIKDANTSDTDEEGWPCLVCGEPYTKCKSGEKWIRCNTCKKWSHLLCTAVEKNHVGYTCDIRMNDSD